jgi:hypothetical protein
LDHAPLARLLLLDLFGASALDRGSGRPQFAVGLAGTLGSGFAEANAWSVSISEFNACVFKSPPYCKFVGGRKRGCSIACFCSSDGIHA